MLFVRHSGQTAITRDTALSILGSRLAEEADE
jgi:hypothetical protein